MSTTNASDTRAFTTSPLSQDPSAQQELGEGNGGHSSGSRMRSQNAGLLDVKKRAANGNAQDASRRVVSEDLGSRTHPAKKRAPRYSAGFLLDSLSILNRKKRKQDAGGTDAAIIQTGTTSTKRLSVAGTTSSSLDGSTSRRSEPSPVPESSFRASTSDRTTTPDYGNDYLSPSRSSKGKERASPGIGEGTSWSMTSPRTSLGFDNSRPSSAQYASPYVQPIDPTTLVQLALNLSQSRRMNLAPGLLAQNNNPNGRRAVSTGYTPMSDSLQPGSSHLGGSLRRDKAGQHNRMSSTSMEERLKQKSSLESTPSAPDNTSFDLAPLQASAGTLARVAKAQAFFQLSSEYRRLLQFLPPLKPRSQIGEDVPLGRAYNPLQYIRNKQVRARGRELLDGETVGWGAVDRVGVWVDMIEVDAQYPEFWSGDVARLQRFAPPGRHRSSSAASTTMSDDTAADAKNLSATIDWTVQPAQLLADAYWLEQGTHKSQIETKDGKAVFETFEPPQMDTIEEDTWQLDNQITDSPQSMKPDSPAPLGTRRRRSSWLGNGRRSFSPRSAASDDNEMSTVGFSPMSQTHKRRGLSSRLLRGRRRAQSAELTEDSGSDDERRLNLGTKGSPKYDNTGPLQKQMQKMIERETQSQPMDTLHEMSPIQQSNSGGRRAAVSDEHQDLGRPSVSTDHERMQPTRVSEDNGTPRISISDFETGASVVADDHTSRPNSAVPTTKRRRRGSRLNFFHKQTSDIHEDNQIEATDFAFKDKPRKLSPIGSPKLSQKSRTGSQPNLRHQAKRTKSGDEDDAASTTGTFFKGSRLGDLVRKERPRVSDFIKRTVRNGSISASDPEDGRVSAVLMSDSDSDDENLSSKNKSRSSNDLHGYYGTNELPTFRSTRVRDEESPHSLPGDHIRRQSQAVKDQKRSSRFEENRLSLKTGSNDISPSTSNVDLARLAKDVSAQRGRPKDRYGRTLSPDDYTDSSRSRSPAMKAARRLNDVLGKPGAPGPDAGLPVTGLGRLIVKRGHFTLPAKDKHMASTTITSKDIAYLRSMLTLTGVKAQTIITRANAVRDPVPSYIVEAASLSNAALAPVTRRQEHVLAASLLSQTLEESIAHVTEEAHAFRNETCTALHRRLDELRETLTAKLMPAVRASGDEADTFVAQLTTTHTLSIKQVNDGVDALVRNRRRRLRLLRSVGFKGLEWVVVCVLWIVWLVVSVLRVVRLLVVGVGRGIKWAFWAS